DQSGSWGWRKILRLRMFLRTMVDYRIGRWEAFLPVVGIHGTPRPSLWTTFPRGPRLLGLHESSRLSTVIHER
ncbi:UNVERIFIED_CONTAM: hypothetical protein Sindi_2899500, partial [Sesamum indicum]